MNRFKMCAIAFVALAISIPTFGAGTVEEASFYSDALGMEKSFQIYLPEGYETSGISYPVVYFIHSMTGSYLSYQAVIDAAEDLISRGLIQPFILVKPDADCMPFADAGFAEPIHSSMTNSELNGDFEDYFVEDLVSRIDADYRTVADRDNRFATGHSQGGYGAVRAGLRHPELFSAVGAHAAPMSFEPLAQIGPFMLLQDYPNGPPYDFRPDVGFVSKILFMFAAAFTPNLSNPPWLVDLPFDEYGQPDPVVFPRLAAQSNTRWATEFKASGAELDIYFEVGTQEELAADYLSLYFATVLDTLELPYTFRWFDGDHHSHIAIRTPNQLTFFMPLNATVEFSPRVLNGRHWWPLVEASIELPGDLDVADIDTSTLAITQINGDDLEEPLRALVASEISDLNGNGRNDLTVWFWKPSLLRTVSGLGIEDHETFDVTVEGETSQGWFLAATDEQRAVNMSAIAAPWMPWSLVID